jgi:ATP-dependent helicase/nuclease subunit B
LIRVLEDISGANGTLVVPSRQRAEAVRLALARANLNRARRVWASPDVLPPDTWLGREIEAAAADVPLPRLLSGAQEWLLWRQCTAQFTDHLQLVARGALAEGLRHASELASEYLIPLGDLAAMNADSEGRLLFDVKSAVEARHAAEGVTTARAAACELTSVGSGRAVEFAGFLNLPPYLAALCRARQARGYTTGARGAPDGERGARKIIAADRTEELECIAAWCRERLALDPAARTLVVLPGAADLRERLAILIRQSLDPRGWVHAEEARRDPVVGIEGGQALAREPMVAHALTALSVLTGAMPFETMSAWLLAPYWRRPDAVGRARVDYWLRQHAPLELDLPTLLASLASRPPPRHAASLLPAGELSARLIGAAAHLEARGGTPREWAVRIRGALDALHWPGDAVRTSAAEQTLQRFNELLNDFGELHVAVRTLRRAEALQVFNELAVRSSFRPASGDALVTVTPFLEDPVVHYEGIWVAGLDASAWPQPVQVNPFLPVAAQCAAGIPAASAPGRAAEARALMLAWRAACDDLVFSVATRDEDLQLMPSPLLGEWAGAPSPPAPSRLWLPASLHREAQLESLIDATAPAWRTAERLPWGTRLLELQSQCAFHAFGELRLGSRALEAPEPGIASLERGNFLHGALEKLWGTLGDFHTLQTLTSAELEGTIATSVARAAHELWGVPLSRAQARESARARQLLGEVCELERTRAPFRVRDIERPVSVLLAGARLDLRIDRVDALEAGGLAILDYKSGAHKTMHWYEDRLSHPQLLAYLAALDEDVRAVATVNVAARDVSFHGIAVRAGLLPKLEAAEAQVGTPGSDAWAQSRQLWKGRIEALVRDFLGGRAAVDPAPQACRHCDVASLCRIADRGLPEEEELEVFDDE